MKTAFVFILVALATGCGSYSGSYHCTSSVLGRIEADRPIDCGYAEFNAKLARFALTIWVPPDHQAPVMTLKQFSDLTSTPILVVSRDSGDLNPHNNGHYNALRGIEVLEDMKALCHELLHAKDVDDAILWTEGHPQWDVKGYHSIDALCEKMAYDVRLPAVQPGS